MSTPNNSEESLARKRVEAGYEFLRKKGYNLTHIDLVHLDMNIPNMSILGQLFIDDCPDGFVFLYAKKALNILLTPKGIMDDTSSVAYGFVADTHVSHKLLTQAWILKISEDV